VRVGILGTGNIAPKYVRGCRAWEVLDVVACADLDPMRARLLADQLEIPRAATVDELLAADDIDLVIDLTPHQAHGTVGLAVVEAGKHLYQEKPFARTVDEGQAILAAARRRGVQVAAAPDGFLGGGLQTCRALIDDGAIGEPLSVFASYVQQHPDRWHPDPESYYRQGGGPLHALGSYLVTALATLLGPITSVSAVASNDAQERSVKVGPRVGTPFRVDVPTHLSGSVQFANGAIGTLVMSYQLHAQSLPVLEIYGAQGSIAGPHPDSYDGPVRRSDGELDRWIEVPLTHRGDLLRGIGVADLAYAILDERAPRASGELGVHVVEVLSAFEDSAATGRAVSLTTSCERPSPLRRGAADGGLR
jgi:predicted dehydrogenase